MISMIRRQWDMVVDSQVRKWVEVVGWYIDLDKSLLSDPFLQNIRNDYSKQFEKINYFCDTKFKQEENIIVFIFKGGGGGGDI